jgi:hypothetical protein
MRTVIKEGEETRMKQSSERKNQERKEEGGK